MKAHSDGSEIAGPKVLLVPESDIELRELATADVDALHELTAVNRGHLTRFGDYEDIVGASREDLARYFADPPDSNARMGIWRRDTLLGRVDLNPVRPRNFVLGYWLGHEHCGRGYATLACRALMEYAARTHAVEAFWAGVKHANVKSIGVLKRLGFTAVEDLPTHIRFRLLVARPAQEEA